MSKEPKKATQANGPVVYCGPTIPGVAKQYTTYTNGTPTALAEAIEKNKVLGGLVVPLDQLPEVRRQFHAGTGRYYTLYRKAQENS
jgi:hypothetical protein